MPTVEERDSSSNTPDTASTLRSNACGWPSTGAGRIGTAHAQVVRDHPDVDAVVLSDADPARAEALATKLGVEAAQSVDKALAGADALVVAASTAAHADLVLRGVRAGVPVFCEKPLAPDVAGSRRVVAEVENAGATVQVGFQRRFDSGYGAARAALRDGRLGELRRVHLLTADQAPPPAEYIPLSGGIFRDCHVHDFDMLRWVTGREVVEVTALGVNRGAAYFAEGGDVDESAGLLTLDDGTLVTLQGSRYNGAGHDIRMELAGTRGTCRRRTVRADARWCPPSRTRPSRTASPGPTTGRGSHPRTSPRCRRSSRWCRGVATAPARSTEALEAFYVAEAATVSRLEHRTVTLDEVRAA